ncbi:hypothetical protein FO440_15540 [Mucilaginibacter corticis]|uniref:Secretion system C-terminal sorting domain-containing protein n=1 Tax=Mucilaginibacter corticis TaxID=2597670 RepID=A0A556MGW3_9SPHI|nr:T9SS type A sorting domain-containing protein [Mucilaginibacter corticis]TSJ39176.1 hypothetical protein FO440_15540 [Mucilaginibacter corticis]
MKRLLLKIISAVALTFLFFFNSANAATLTIASVGTTAGSNGLAANPLSINQTGIAVMGFSAKSSAGTISATQFVFTGSAAIGTNLSNFKLYSSTNSTYTSGTDPLVAGATSVISGSTITFSFPAASAPITTTTTYYFLIADYTVTSSASSTYTFSVTGATSAGNTLSGLPKSGPTYTLSSYTCDWLGSTTNTAAANNWNTASNWSNNHIPATYDIVNIAVNQLPNYNPVINSGVTVNVSAINFGGQFTTNNGTATPLYTYPGITVTGTLNVSGDISTPPDGFPGSVGTSTPIPLNQYTLSGAGTVTANNISVSGVYGSQAAENCIQVIYSSVASLTVNGDVTLLSEDWRSSGFGATTYHHYANFIQTTGTVSIAGKIKTTPTTNTTTYTTSTFQVKPTATATLLLADAAVLSNLSANGTNVIDVDNTGVTVNYNGASQTVYTSSAPNVSLGVPYYNLILSGTGTATPGTGTVTVANDFTTTATAANFNTNNTALTVSDISYIKGGTMTLGSGNFTTSNGLDVYGSSVFNAGSGNILDGNFFRVNVDLGSATVNFSTGTTTIGNAMQLYGGTVNAGSGPISIAAASQIYTGATLNAGTAAASSFTFTGAYTNNTGGAFTAGGGNVYYNSAYTNNGTFTAGTGTVNFNFGGGQALADNSTAGTLFNNVSFNGAGTKKITNGVFGVSSIGVLTVGTATTKFDPGGFLTMYASSSNPLEYAQIAPVTGQIISNLNYQVYFQGGAGYRNYRSMAAPVYTGAFSTSNGTYPLSTLKGSFIITGTSGSTNGFDKSFNNGFTLKTYSPATGYSFITSLLTNPTIATGSGFYMYYRGNRTVPSTGVTATDPFGSKTNKSSTGSYSIPESVTYTYTGIPNQGPYSVSILAAPTAPATSPYYFLANPYAATLDANAVINSAVTGVIYFINQKTWVWNPSVANYAVYSSINPLLITNGAKQYLVPGQGFFIQGNNLSGSTKTLTITENMKSVNNNSNAARFLYTADPVAKDEMPIFRLQFIKDRILSDEIAVGLTDSAKAGYDKNDATHLEGTSLTLSSLTPDNQYLAIDVRPFTAKSTVIPLYITPDIDTTYSMKLSYKNTSMNNFKVLLADSLLGKTTDISNAAYTFKVTPGTANTYGKRFKLFVQAQTAPVVFADFRGSIDKTKTVTLKWTSENTVGNIHYQVQRSADKTTFTDIGSTVLSPSTEEPVKTTYTVLDKAPLVGLNYYRLVQTDMFGNVLYSDTITVANNPGFNNGVAKTGFILYPNPVKDVLSIVSDKSFSKKVVMKVYDTQGILKFTQTYNDGITAQIPVQANVNKLQTGVYVVLITNNEKELVALKFKKQ